MLAAGTLRALAPAAHAPSESTACPRCGRRLQPSLLTSPQFWGQSENIAPLRQPSMLHAARNPAGTSVPRQTTKAYEATSIQVLEGLQPVRKRPGMYIGSTGPAGLHHLVYEVVDNAIDEAQAGYATEINVILEKDGSCTVVDNGRGIPCDMHPTTGKSALETVLTVLHSGGKFNSESYKVSGGLHGVGISVVNALSEKLTVTVRRDGLEYSQQYRRGKPQKAIQSKPFKPGRGESKTSTRLNFLPDATIFKEGIVFDMPTLATRMRELAYLNRGIKVTLQDCRASAANNDVQTFIFEGGLSEYVRYLTKGKTPIHEVIHIVQTVKNVQVEVALLWCADSYAEALLGFANSIRTIDGGTHLEGLKLTLTKVLNSAGRDAKKVSKEDHISAEYLREGLTAIVSVKLPDPEFEGQTKTKLGNPEVKKLVDEAISENLRRHFVEHSDELARILEKAKAAAKAADAARRARDVERSKSVLKNNVLLSKLSDCSSMDPRECEIFIVEGESAGGTAKQARDRRTQAVLPLRGKILNVEKTDDRRLFKNTEILTLIRALGLGIKGQDFQPADLRYHKIIILTDADVDGAHICTLLLTFFYRYNKALYTNGHIYIATPPLYKFTSGDKKYYCHSEAQLETFKKQMRGDAQRFKGLGEMNSEELFDTTMDPTKRLLKQITADDAGEVEATVKRLMGHASSERREVITDFLDNIPIEDLDI